MTQAILDIVNGFAEDMQLHYTSPNRDTIREILQLDATELSSLGQEQVSCYVFALGQYLVTLQYNENMAIIEHKLAQKTFEYELNKCKLSKEGIVGKTAKERDAWVLINVPEVEKLYTEAQTLDAKKLIIDGMVRAVEGLLNALKKEMSGRYSD